MATLSLIVLAILGLAAVFANVISPAYCYNLYLVRKTLRSKITLALLGLLFVTSHSRAEEMPRPHYTIQAAVDYELLTFRTTTRVKLAPGEALDEVVFFIYANCAGIGSQDSRRKNIVVDRVLLQEKRQELQDRVSRALGTLQHATMMTSDETMELLSSVRMGVNLGLIDDLSIATVNELFIHTQPAHLQKIVGEPLDGEARNAARARYLRTRLRSAAAD